MKHMDFVRIQMNVFAEVVCNFLVKHKINFESLSKVFLFFSAGWKGPNCDECVPYPGRQRSIVFKSVLKKKKDSKDLSKMSLDT